MTKRTLAFEDGLKIIQKGVGRVIRILEGKSEEPFDSKLYMELYTAVYLMSYLNKDHRERLYNTYRDIFRAYLSAAVLPCLTEKKGEFMLREFVRRWANNKIMTRWLSGSFSYLDRCHIPEYHLPRLELVGVNIFRDLVYSEVKERVRDSAIAMTNEERKGKKVDRSLFKNVLEVFLEIGKEQDDGKENSYYEEDFEKHMIEEIGAYYSRRASSWILECSCADYIRIAEECLKNEKERLSHYLCPTTVEKLVERVLHEVVVVHMKMLLEKGAGSSLEDLSRMFQKYVKVSED